MVVGNLTVQDAVLMRPEWSAGPSGPKGPHKGKRRFHARGKRPRPAYFMAIQTTGVGGVLLKDIQVSGFRYNGSALINVAARPAREVVVEGLTVSDLPDVEAIQVSPGSTLSRR